MDIDERIKMVMKKIEELSSKKNPEFDSCGEFPPKWEKPFTEKRVADFEEKKGIKLPPDYRRFITTVASAGTQPFYGLYSLFDNEVKEVEVEKPFITTVRKPLLLEELEELDDEEYDKIFEDPDCNVNCGFIPLCTEGCGMDSILVVNSEDEETYGTVWYYDFANDAGTLPLINPKNGKTMDFLDWLEYYADRTLSLELSNEDFFGYAEIAGFLKDE